MHVIFESNTLPKNSKDSIDEPIEGEVLSKQNDTGDHSKPVDTDTSDLI